MMGSKEKKEKPKNSGLGLVDIVFSWSIADVMNKDYYSDKVIPIPERFTSKDEYLNSFMNPLLEETRAGLYSNMTTLSRAPFCEVFDVNVTNDFKAPKDLYYKISLMKPSNGDDDDKKEKKGGVYEPEFGDLIAFTDVRPRFVDDLNRPKMPYVLGLVRGMKEEGSFRLPILASKPIEFKKEERGEKGKKREKLFAVYLTNLNTNMRIWKALNPDPEVTNMSILETVLEVDPNVYGACPACSSQNFNGAPKYCQSASIQRFRLDRSQETAVLNCIDTKNCHHQNTVKLIWGPPGTGKTKTVATLLISLFKMKCRTLTCAPTNVAVIGVINRLMSLLRPYLKHGFYGLGDIVLFGNAERMKIDDHEELHDVFLSYRVSCLAACFAPLTGFRGSIDAMICLLEDPGERYQRYLSQGMENDKQSESDDDENVSDDDEKGDGVANLGLKGKKDKLWRKVISQTLKANKKKKGKDKLKKEVKGDSKKNRKEQNKEVEDFMTFEDFFMKQFVSIGNRLIFCISSLYTHMPTSFIQERLADVMVKVEHMLQSLRTSFHNVAANGWLRAVFHGFEAEVRGKRNLNELIMTRLECLRKMKHIQKLLARLPNFIEDYQIKGFCLANASLIFCTASGSSKLHTEDMELAPLELLIIDEAAQLKECESTIPLQLAGLRHAILIGDQKQLPAMVQSKIAEKAGFGRSLFERLERLGVQKNLLNVQYRMHPSISLFPNRHFYGRKIMDGPNVKKAGYKKTFLKGNMYGSYSFIDINNGQEMFDEKHSKKNPLEVDVVAAIIANLHKQFLVLRQRVRVGCISPYKAQVFALQEKLGKTYSTDVKSDFSVNVRSVDGFQGGEEDIIIISTVRCNATGSIGFLSDHQRTNVALTRARHCLWILGNSSTLLHSGSVWKELVLDAKSRGCFYNARDDPNLAGAISSTLISRPDDLLDISHSMLFKNARWKVCFKEEFTKSFDSIKDSELRKLVVSLLVSLSSGWRKPQQSHPTLIKRYRASALLLELYNVKGPLKLIWNVGIQRENSRDVQVMIVWDVLPVSEIPNLARRTEQLFGSYSVSTLSRCRFRKMKRNLVVPASWPLELHSGSSCEELTEILAGGLAKVSLRDDPKPSEKHHGIGNLSAS